MSIPQITHYSVADSIVDTMGDYITFEKIENIDGTYHYEDASKTLTWNPASNGATGEQVIENGILTGYQYNLHQLVYSVHLNAEQEGFHSCASNMGSVVGEKESYPVNNTYYDEETKQWITKSKKNPTYDYECARYTLTVDAMTVQATKGAVQKVFGSEKDHAETVSYLAEIAPNLKK